MKEKSRDNRESSHYDFGNIHQCHNRNRNTYKQPQQQQLTSTTVEAISAIVEPQQKQKIAVEATASSTLGIDDQHHVDNIHQQSTSMININEVVSCWVVRHCSCCDECFVFFIIIVVICIVWWFFFGLKIVAVTGIDNKQISHLKLT